jgi:acyl-CoA-binding protein
MSSLSSSTNIITISTIITVIVLTTTYYYFTTKNKKKFQLSLPDNTNPSSPAFLTASQTAKTLTNISNEDKLRLYGLFKRVTVPSTDMLDPNTKPSLLDFVERAKWDAWDQATALTPQQAEEAYIALVQTLSGNPNSTLKSTNSGGGTGGPKISTLKNNHMITENEAEGRGSDEYERLREDLTEENLRRTLKTNPTLIHEIDQNQQTLLHWAVDGDNEAAVAYLIEQGSNVNAQDANGLTPLCYAAELDMGDMVDVLLKAGADPTIIGLDGQNAWDLTPKKGIIRKKYPNGFIKSAST